MSRANEMLGYPADARLLIVNADDLGVYHAVNEAIFRAFSDGVLTSASLIVPCPWSLHALQVLGDHPEIAFGVHLTLATDFDNYRWGPLSPKEKVPSLIDRSGYFHRHEPGQAYVAGFELGEVELEFRAQIEAVLAAGLRPTHLDWHCLLDGGRADIFELTLGLAREYGLVLRVSARDRVERLRRRGLPTVEHGMMDSTRLETDGKTARFVQMLRDLPVGLSEWAVHPGRGTAEARAIDGWWAKREADFQFLVSEAARETVRAEGIILLDYRALQRVWSQAGSHQAA